MSSSIAFQMIPAYTPERVGLIRELFQEYERSLGISLCFQNFSEELAGLPGRYSPPDGRLYVCSANGKPMGCVGLRRADRDSAEMKRLYVRPRYRGLGFGRRIATTVINDARSMGYRRVVLDTLPSMREAQGIYASLGFAEIAAYTTNPVEGARCLGISLQT